MRANLFLIGVIRIPPDKTNVHIYGGSSKSRPKVDCVCLLSQGVMVAIVFLFFFLFVTFFLIQVKVFLHSLSNPEHLFLKSLMSLFSYIIIASTSLCNL